MSSKLDHNFFITPIILTVSFKKFFLHLNTIHIVTRPINKFRDKIFRERFSTLERDNNKVKTYDKHILENHKLSITKHIPLSIIIGEQFYSPESMTHYG